MSNHWYWPTRIVLSWAMVILVVAGAGCRQRAPVVDLALKPAAAHGTLSGTVSGPAGASVADGRVVEAVNLDTGERQQAVTNKAGGFSFRLPPGKYRVQLALRDGESIVKEPGVIDLNRRGVDAHADIVIGSIPISHPHNGYRSDDGLGAPMA